MCAVLLALILLILLAIDGGANDADADGVPPEVDTNGLCVVEVVQAPEYEMYFTEADVIALSRMLYGEARGCTTDNQMKCVMKGTCLWLKGLPKLIGNDRPNLILLKCTAFILRVKRATGKIVYQAKTAHNFSRHSKGYGGTMGLKNKKLILTNYDLLR